MEGRSVFHDMLERSESLGVGMLNGFSALVGGDPSVVVSTAVFHARVRGSVPGLGG